MLAFNIAQVVCLLYIPKDAYVLEIGNSLHGV
jgi:hypothetical protein